MTNAVLTFVGTQFNLTYTGHVNRGNLDVYVDNVKVGTINQYSSSLTWQKTWTSPTFTNGTHTLKLVHATGSIVGIDAIEIDPAPPVPVGTGTYDDTDTAWGYSGNWTALSTSGPANGTLHYSTGTGDYAELNFVGTQLQADLHRQCQPWQPGRLRR